MEDVSGIFPLAETVPVRRGSAPWTSTKGSGYCDPVNKSLHVPDGATPGETHIRVHELTHAYISPAKARRPEGVSEMAIQRAEDARCNAYDRAWGIADLLRGVCSPEDVKRLTAGAERFPRSVVGLREAVTAAVSVQNTGDQPAMAERIRDIYSGDDAWIADKILAFARSAASYMDRSAANLPDDGRKGWGSTVAVARKADRYAQTLADEIQNPAPQPQPQPEQEQPEQEQPQPEQDGGEQDGEQPGATGEQPEQQPEQGGAADESGDDAPASDPAASEDDETGQAEDSPDSGDGAGSSPQDEQPEQPEQGDGGESGEQPGEQPGEGESAPGSGGESSDGGEDGGDDLDGLFGGDPATDGDAALDDGSAEIPVKIAPPVGAGGAGAGSEMERIRSGGNDAVERQLEPVKKLAEVYKDSAPWPSDIPLWGEMEIQTPPLKLRLPPKLRGRRMRATDAGAVMQYAHRDETDGQIFAERGSKLGGATILIDCSGSTNITAADIERILELAPAAIIATYAGGRYSNSRRKVKRNEVSFNVDHAFGQLRIVAKNGRRCKPDLVLPGRYGRDLITGETRLMQQFGGNMVDGPALDWLRKQPGPRYWISDGKVVGNGSRTLTLFADAIRKCRLGKIERVDSVRGVMDALKSRKMRKR